MIAPTKTHKPIPMSFGQFIGLIVLGILGLVFLIALLAPTPPASPPPPAPRVAEINGLQTVINPTLACADKEKAREFMLVFLKQDIQAVDRFILARGQEDCVWMSADDKQQFDVSYCSDLFCYGRPAGHYKNYWISNYAFTETVEWFKGAKR
jgi:hypothetical protein